MILGEATDADLNEMASHEAQCPACAAVRAEVASSDERLLALDQAPPMEADFHASWVRAIKEEDMNRSKKRDTLDGSSDESPDGRLGRSFPIVRWVAIAAGLLGASQVLALDIDPDAVKVAEDNVRLNHLSHAITCQRGSLVPATLFDGTAVPVITPSCRLIMANIVADVILSALPAIRSADIEY